MTLDKTPLGSTVRIVSLENSDVVTLRLMEMGMVPGSTVRVVKSAPLGDPIQICLRNYHLALRRNEARAITVASCD
jgi:ferrous iron transport protein A